jgi:anaerobic ribonucleoside-triphosphate reductase activating protein
MATDLLRVHGFVPRSAANGPGIRAVLWVQGCTFACPGCFNPETHSRAGDSWTVRETVDRIVALGDGIDGLTVSGGEPLQQRRALSPVLREIRERTALSTLVFTGYGWDEVCRMPDLAELRGCVDVLIAGRYEQSRRIARGLRGSSNKTVHFFGDRYGPADLADLPDAELIIGPAGQLVMTGIDPAGLSLPGGERIGLGRD